MYVDAVEDLLSKSASYNIEKILLPIGQDFFHINNAENTTVKGTAQDVDGRPHKVFEAGYMAVIKAINNCLRTAPVEVLWIPGNHDRETSYYLAKYLEAYYRNTDHVTVDAGSKSRKYYHYGVTLLGFTHGNEEPHRDLPIIMASECSDIWNAVTCREWHVGHFHKRKETRYLAGDSFGAVGVRILPSLSGTDKWHYDKGYVNSHRVAEAYLWNLETGYAGHFPSDIKIINEES